MHQSLAAENSVFCTSPQAPPSPSGLPPKPNIAGPAISLLLGTLRRTQEALAALHTKREAHFNPFSPIPEDRGRRGPTGFPLNAFRSTKPPYPQLRRSRIRGLQVRGRIQRETHRVPVRATGLSITPCSAVLPKRRSQSKESGSCTRPSSPRPSRPGSYAPREGRGPGR